MFLKHLATDQSDCLTLATPTNKMAENLKELALLWERKPELYDNKFKDYRDRNKKKLAYQEIAQHIHIATTGKF